MKLVTAIIQPHRLEKVRESLTAIGIEGMTVSEGDVLPGGLEALHAPGPCEASFALLYQRPGGSVLFAGDLVVHEDDGSYRFVPDEYLEEPARTRDSARAILERRFKFLCTGHGPPALSGARLALGEALRHDH